ncbi:MAG: hypothetical protein IT416_02400 [Candidatus Pacebacteria bacterium]|nr:hypothetical protein [Candidatus Paceibacterota bacterium]
MNKEIFKETVDQFGKHFLTVVAYVLVLLPFIQGWFSWLLFLIGAILGVSLAIADAKYLYTLYQEEQPVDQVDFGSGIGEEKSPIAEKFIVSQSTLYVISLVPTAIFVFTSSGSFLAMGLMGGLIIFLLVEMLQSLDKPALFFSKFLVQANFEATQHNLKKIIISSVLFFMMLHFLVLL